ncbi:MAG: NAD(P)-binding protein [Acidimicrobiales bacterium]
MDETYDVVVVGAGLAGLTAAATAAAASPGRSVLVLDNQPAGRGGRAATDQVGRFRFNRGAHALYRTTPGHAVLDRLGVKVVGHPPPTKNALGRLGDRLGLLPLNASTLARTNLLTGREKLVGAKILSRVGKWQPQEWAGLTATELFDDFGVDGTLRQLCEMLCRLTGYVADVDVVSADLVAGQVQAALTGSVDYLDQGWSSLVDGLAAAGHRDGVRVEGGVRVHAVIPDQGRVRIEAGERTLLARQVVLAAGTPEANAALLPEAPPSWGQLAPAARAACLDLGLATEPANRLVLGIDQPLYLSRHAPPAAIAPVGTAVYQTVLYLRSDEDPSADEARAVLAAHCRVSGIDPDEAEESRYLHRMVVCGALPTPETGGMAGRPSVSTGLDGVLVAGDWVGPAGHLADAALVSGEVAGQVAAAALDKEVVTRA